MASKKLVQFVTTKAGTISRLTFNRPAARETRFTIKLPLPHDGAEKAMVERSYEKRAALAVVAYDPYVERAVECGTFIVTDRGETTFTLKSAVVKEAREAAVNQLHARVHERVNELNKTKQKQKEKRGERREKEETVPVLFLPPPPADVPPPPPPADVPPLATTVYARPQPAATVPDVVVQPVITSFFQRSNLPKAIPTTFNGTNYRSRLESKFARMLDALHVRFVYEPMRVRTGDKGSYTIDFFLPDQQLYVELKPKRPHVEEERKCEDMSKLGFRVVLMYGEKFYKLPYRSEFYNGRSHRDYDHHDAVRGMCWVNGAKLPGDTVFVVGTHASMHTPLDVPSTTTVHLNQVQTAYDMRWSHPTIKDALHPLKFM